MGILGKAFFLKPEPGFKAAHLVSNIFSLKRTTSSKDSLESMLNTNIKISPKIRKKFNKKIKNFIKNIIEKGTELELN